MAQDKRAYQVISLIIQVSIHHLSTER